MEDVLDVYQRPYDPECPLVCMDETSKQLTDKVCKSIPVSPGKPDRQYAEYIRNCVCIIFIGFEPLAGKRKLTVTDQRKKHDWALFIKDLVDEQYPAAKKIVLVMDNLNTHNGSSLYEAFAPDEAKRILNKLEIHYTPKHGSWLNMAEIEFSHLARQCLDRRIPNKQDLVNEVAAWEDQRNKEKNRVDWQFTTKDARIKLRRLYPVIIK